MKKNMRTVVLAIGAFVAGVVATLAILYIFVLPDMAMDIGVFANEGAIRAYEVGYNDGQNGTDNFSNWFDDEVVETVNNYEYKFIK